MSRAPLNVIEWLEDMRRFASRDADRATEVLELIGQAEWAEDIIGKILNGEKIEDDDADGIVTRLAGLDEFESWSDDDDLVNETDGETVFDRWKNVAERAKALEAQSFALSELCMAAGLLKPNDYKTDPLPLLRMFLPVDE